MWTDRLARLRKLRVMPAPELMSRAAYEAVTAWERVVQRTGQPTSEDRLAAAMDGSRLHGRWRTRLLRRRRQRPAAFLAGSAHKAGAQELFRTRYSAQLTVTKEKAEQACRHEFEFFGQRFAYGADIDWHADPVSRRRWPLVYHRDVPIHDPATPFGDVKYVWELNRQQFLLDLGKVCFLEGRADHATEVVAIVKSWLAQNPVGRGVNWACALEPAFRALSWLWAYHLCLDSDGLDEQSHLAWLAGFHDHGSFLYRNLERYASPYNHLVGEAAALYALGVLFPEFRSARAWRRCGRRVLESRLSEQFYSDGGSVEQSTFYHHATLGFYIFAALIGRANGEEFSDPVWRAIERGIEFSMYLTQPDGTAPPIGGADDGKPIRLEHRRLWDFRAFQAVGAVLLGRCDMKHAAGDFPEDAWWLLGEPGRARFETMADEPPSETDRALTASGYLVSRSSWSRDADYLCFDCGEQAGGVRRDSIPNAVHGHADCLSVILWLSGRPVLADPGVYCYNGDPEWVGHFRRTTAHSTVSVDGRDQARYRGKMSWSNTFTPHLEAWHARAGEAWAMGWHDGFDGDGRGIVHRRAAWLRPGGYAVVWDEITGDGDHELTWRFQFAPGVAHLCDAGELLFEEIVDLAWVASVPTAGRLQCGGSAPEDGWIAPSLGVRVPAPVLTVTAAFQAPCVTLLTVLADRSCASGLRRVQRVTAGRHGMAVMVRGDGWTDWIVSGDVRGTLPFATDGKLGVWRVRDERVAEASTIGGGWMTPGNQGDRVDLPEALVTVAPTGGGR